MLGKKEIKDIQSLEQKKFRDDLGLFIAEGPKIVRELLLEKRSMVQQLYATESWIRQNSNILTPACVAVSEQELGRISQQKRAARWPYWPAPLLHYTCLRILRNKRCG